jgi:hypothetical protein
MLVSEFKNHLNTLTSVQFIQPNGVAVPSHFHVTEMGLTTKNFVDCGGTVRSEKNLSFQLWVANDVEHRLVPDKLKGIITKSEKLFGSEDLEVEVEYQSETIGRYGLSFDGINFVLTTKQTNCLAQDHCGIPAEKMTVEMSNAKNAASCAPGGGCC